MRAILYVFSACFALLILIGSVRRQDLLSNLETYWPRLPNRLATPFVDHLLVAVSVIAASLLFGAAVVRRSPIERLSQLRKIGVPLRIHLLRAQWSLSYGRKGFGLGEKK